jgi:hypothetical protein
VEPDEPIPVRVWIQARQSGEFLAEAHAIAWTDKQVRVRYIDKHGREGFVWLWADAVTRP